MYLEPPSPNMPHELHRFFHDIILVFHPPFDDSQLDLLLHQRRTPRKSLMPSSYCKWRRAFGECVALPRYE